jgi:hypothetical protein
MPSRPGTPCRTSERFARRELDLNDPGFAVGSNMDKVAAHAISAFIVGFGLWILVAGLSSSSALLICAALIPIAVGLVSAVGPT